MLELYGENGLAQVGYSLPLRVAEATLLLLCAGLAVHLAADVVVGSNSSQAVGDGRRAVT